MEGQKVVERRQTVGRDREEGLSLRNGTNQRLPTEYDVVDLVEEVLVDEELDPTLISGCKVA